MTNSTPHPLVSVVVIVYNDARRLPTAVRSVLRQSLRRVEVIIADDCSTDETPAVAQSLVDLDPRVRYVRLPRNSGGCGAPRNAGLRAAHADRVMFLDSDDRLERHACKNLLEALEDGDADFSMGLVRREYLDTKRQTLWYPRFFDERRVLESIHDLPELIVESLSVNKLYRRSFLDDAQLRFPEDIHYEDQVFTIQAYTKARRIAIIPENVYLWRISPAAKNQSISNQRHRLENFASRLEANRRIDEYLTDQGLEDLRQVKDAKFLTHDMRLYLADVIVGDAALTKDVLALAQPYLRSIPEERYHELAKALAAAYAMAFRCDLQTLRETMLFDRRNVMAFALSSFDEREWVSGTAAATGPDPDFSREDLANTLADVSGAGWSRAPFSTYHMHHELTGVEGNLRGGVLRGTTHDTLGKFAKHDDWSLSLLGKAKGSEDVVRLPIEIDQHDGHGLTWHVRLRGGSGFFRFVMPVEWNLRVEVTLGANVVESPLFCPPGFDPAPFPVHLPSQLAHGRPAAILRDGEGRARLRASAPNGFRRRALRAVDRRLLARVEAWRASRHELDEAEQSTTFERLQHLPIDNHLAVFEANMGTVYGDSPKYIYQRMRQLRPDIRCVWVLPEGARPPHPDTKTVVRGSSQYLRVLAQARYWVDNQTFPGYVRKRPGQRYLQTWHGIPLKRMGKDILGWKPPERRADRGIGAWDSLVVPSPYFEETFVPAFDYVGKQIRYGTPRNDILVNGTMSRADARRLLDLPVDARVVLYAPTFRESQRDRSTRVTLPFETEELLDALGPDYFLLLRPHYLNRIHVPGATRYRALDASKVADVNLLYLAADVLVTDYSSVMFDFALLGRPMVFHTFDYDDYLTARGTYFDLKQEAPGPFTASTDELIEAIRAAEGGLGPYRERHEQFVAKYCGVEDGHASERAVLALLGEDDA